MRVLWVCNIMLPKIARHRNPAQVPADGGWLTGLCNSMLQQEEVELAVCFPIHGLAAVETGEVDGLKYYGFGANMAVLHEYNPQTEEHLREIMAAYQPDVVEIFGTEYPHSLAAVRAFGKPERTAIHIQGLVTYYARHFMANLPEKVQREFTFRDFMRRDNLKIQQQKFLKRAVFEQEALRGVNHILGRTDWDRACAKEINPLAAYHVSGESLRDSFYENQWNMDTCQKHSIFVSQGSYPIKGFHFVVEALPEILKRFPDAHVYVSGGDITRCEGFKDKLKMSSYAKYLRNLIHEKQLESHITFTGFLNEEAMCKRYLQSHVFVSPSSIENSPNSVGEAMILGVPVVTSDVGGVKSMMKHGVDGFVYQMDAPYMLSYYVCEIFENNTLALSLSHNGRARAMDNHNRKKNVEQLLTIYREMMV